MNRVRQCVLIGWLLAMGVSLAGGAESPLGADSLRARQHSHERARTMTRELVRGLLDVQLARLRQNGLDKAEVFREIEAMRRQIDKLVDAEMAEVVGLLEQAQKAGEGERRRLYEQARQSARKVVARLAVERQNLARRLKLAEVAAQTKRLIERETAVLDQTTKIPEQSEAKQAESTLAAIQDQRDVQELYGTLVHVLTDVGGWGGEAGAGALEGLLILKTAQVEQDIVQARLDLEKGDAAGARRREEAAIRGLGALLDRILQAQGQVGSDQEALLAVVRETMRKQERVLKATRAEPLTDVRAGKLSEDQLQIHKDLRPLNDGLAALPTAAAALARAKEAAFAARDRIFELDQTKAVTEQARVLAQLAEIERQLLDSLAAESKDRSAAELAKGVAALRNAKQQVEKARDTQEKLAARSKSDASSQREAAQGVAGHLQRALEQEKLPRGVEASLRQAVSAAEETARTAEQNTTSSGREALESALERAWAETQTALNDLTRKALAVEAGEQARGAELLERAAAKEREIGQASGAAAKQDGLTSPMARQMAKEQKELGEIARKTAQAFEGESPQVAKWLAEASEGLSASEKSLEQAAEGKRIGTPREVASQVANVAEETASQLEKAAAQLRRQAGETANKLAEEAERQLADVRPVHEGVEKLASGLPLSLEERLARLDRAEDKAAQAAAEQQRAVGKSGAAERLNLQRSIRRAMQQQEGAERAARELASGRADSPHGVSQAQQAAAATIREAAEVARGSPKTEPAAAGRLEQAAGAAESAAKEILSGNPSAAARARGEVERGLAEALREVENTARQTASEGGGRPDARAQEQVTQLAGEAKGLASADAPRAAATLEEAAASSAAAVGGGAKGAKKEATNPAGESTAKSLETAIDQIRQAKADLAQEQSRRLADRAETVGESARKSGAVDAHANAALRDAERAARGAAEGKNSAQAIDRAVEVRQAVDRAATSLTARKERIELDKAIAESMARLAREQEAARQEIVRTAGAIDRMAEGTQGQADGEQGQSDGRQQMASEMRSAQQAFASAQAATGQGAEQISGQQRVANPPLREAMDMASKLPFGSAGSPSLLSDAGESQSSSSPGEGADSSGDAANSRASGTAAQAGRSNRSGANDSATGLGQGFVPSTPEVTASLIAGPKASATAAEAMGQAGSGQTAGQSSGEAASADGQQAGASKGSDGQGKAASEGGKSGAATAGTPGNPGSSQADGGKPAATPAGRKAGSSAEGSAGPLGGAKERAWFAKLPPELRASMRSGGKGRPPRGYEERLRRYFDSAE